MYDIIHISMENWGTVWRRNQHIAAGLAKRFPNRQILYVGLETDLSHSLRRGHWSALRKWRAQRPRRVGQFPNIWVFQPTKWLPNSVSICRRINQAIVRRQIRAAVRHTGLEDPLLYINPYYAAHMPGHLGEWATVYDVGEDWTAFGQNPSLSRLIARQDDDLTRRADAVIVVSAHLFAMKRAAARNLHLIPNGVAAERYLPVCSRQLRPHPLTAGWPRPVLGHTGTLQPQRTNVDLLIHVATSFPHGTIALVGPDDLDAHSRQRLAAVPNVRLVGAIDHVDLPRVMSAFDVCIVPHRVTAFSDSQCPLKLFEYLAAGLPIVSTPVAGFRDYPQLVYLAEDAAFVQAIGRALREPADLSAQRQQAATAHTWDARLDAFIKVLRDLLPKAPAPLQESIHDLDNHFLPAPAC